MVLRPLVRVCLMGGPLLVVCHCICEDEVLACYEREVLRLRLRMTRKGAVGITVGPYGVMKVGWRLPGVSCTCWSYLPRHPTVGTGLPRHDDVWADRFVFITTMTRKGAVGITMGPYGVMKVGWRGTPDGFNGRFHARRGSYAIADALRQTAGSRRTWRLCRACFPLVRCRRGLQPAFARS